MLSKALLFAFLYVFFEELIRTEAPKHFFSCSLRASPSPSLAMKNMQLPIQRVNLWLSGSRHRRRRLL